MDVTVVIATFGDYAWIELAQERAVASAEALDVDWVHVHAGSLHEARNRGLAKVDTEYVCHLDADDELEPGYFEAMATGTCDLRAPAVRYVEDGHPWRPKVPSVAGHRHACEPECLAEGNYLIVGTVARTELLRDVGGWHDWPIYEDYDLWARCWKASASIETIPAAIYRAHVRRDSRNRGPSRDLKHATHQAIAEANGLLVPA